MSDDCIIKIDKDQIVKSKLQLESFLLVGTFPDEGRYSSSAWADWKHRIEEGRESEEKSIAKQVDRWKAPEGSEKWPFDPGDWINDAYWQNCRLTNSMYASMVVSLWSDVEHFLKSLLQTCKLKDAWDFGKIKKRFGKELDIDFENLDSYSILNTIRILNNSFKHSDGYYKPDKNMKHTQISQDLLDEWNILRDNDEIDYSKLPIKTLVLACNTFANDLLRKIEPKLKAREN